MKFRMRRTLGIIMSIVLLMTSLSVGFVVSAATPIEDLVAALNAIPDGEENAFTVTSTHADNVAPSTNSTARAHNIQDDSSNGSIFDAAIAFSAYFNASGTLNTGGATAATAQAAANNTWWTKLYNNLVANDDIDAKYYPLLSALCDNAAGRGSSFLYDYCPTRGTIASVSSSNRYMLVRVSVTRSEEVVLKQYGTDIASMPASVLTTQTYGRVGQAQATSGSTNYWYFNTTASNPATTNSNTIVTRLKAVDNFFTDAKLASDPMALDATGIQTEVTNMNAAYSQFNALTDTQKATYFTAEKVAAIDAYATAVEEAFSVINYKADVEYFQEADGFVDTIDAGYDTSVAGLADMEALWNAQQVHYTRLAGVTAAQKEMLERLCGLDMAAIDAARAQLFYDIQIAQLTDLKAQIDAIYNQYVSADRDYKDVDVYYDLLLQYLDRDLSSLLATVNTKLAANIAVVFTDGTGYITEILEDLQYEMLYRGLGAINNGNKAYYLGIMEDDYSKVSSAKIVDKIKEAKDRLTLQLSADILYAQTNLKPADFEFLYANFQDYAEAAIDRLTKVLSPRFDQQVAGAKKAYVKYGDEINWDNFALVKSMINMIDDVIYDYLKGTNYLDADTVEIYLWLKDAVIDEFNAFIKDGGYDTFIQLKLDPYPTRDVMVNDLLKTMGYDVTDENLQMVLDKLDEFLLSDSFAELTGMDISACIGGLTSCMCSDKMVNCAVGILYPAVLDAFEGAWAGLPTSVPNDDAKVTLSVEPLHSVLAKDTSTNTIKGIAAYPDLMGALLPADFTAAKAALASTATDANWVVNEARPRTLQWENSSINEIIMGKVVDLSSYNPATGTFTKETDVVASKKLNIDWGVENPTSAKMQAMTKSERFRYAMSSALLGLQPLLGAMLLGQPFAGYADKVATLNIVANASSSVTAKADPVFLDLKATGNEGYAKVLTLVFEALLGEDTDSIPTAEEIRNFTTTAQVYDAVANPIHAFLDKLAAAPLNTLAEILPNLAYAMSFDVLSALFAELSVIIQYQPDGEIAGCSCITKTLNKAEDGKTWVRDNADGMAGTVGVVLSDMLGDGLDISCTGDLNGIVQMVPSCFMDMNLKLPNLNAGCLARLGEMDTSLSTKRVGGEGQWSREPDGTKIEQTVAPACTDERHYIKADKADVAYGMLSYLLSADFLDAMVSSFDLGDISLDAIYPSFSGDNQGNAIAAFIELLFPEKYDLKPSVNAEDLAAAQAGEVTVTQDVKYNLIWTKNYADNLTKDLEDFVTKTLQLLFNQNLDELLFGSFGGSVYTHATLEKLLGMVNDLIGDFDLSSIIDVLDPMVNIPLAPIAELLKTDVSALAFTDGNKDEFLAAVNELFAPVVPVLDILLAGNNIEILDGFITAYGYEGYANGVIPILEALSCNPALIKTPAEFEADSANKVANLLAPIFDLLDTIMQAPVDTALSILPNLMYFADSGMLHNSVYNVCHPVFVILDVIRPIYDVNLNLNLTKTGLMEMLTGLIGMELPFDTGSLVAGSYEVYTSKNGQEAVRVSMQNVGKDGQADYITTVLRSIVGTVLYGENMSTLKSFVDDISGLNAAGKKSIKAVLDIFGNMSVDAVLYGLYSMFYGVDKGVDGGNAILDLINKELKKVSDHLNSINVPLYNAIVDTINKLLGGSIIDSNNGLAPNGLMPFITAIINILQNIFSFFQRIFGF